MSQGLPLCVDLDGTLIRSDMLHESSLGTGSLGVLKIPFWLASGKAVLKRKLAEQFSFDPSSALHYNDALIAWLRQQHAGALLSAMYGLRLAHGGGDRFPPEFVR